MRANAVRRRMAEVGPESSAPPEWAARALASEFRFPRIGPLEAARRHWLLVLVPIAAFAAIAIALTAVRHPTYTAQSQLSVGRLDVAAPGAVSGFELAVQTLAADYSRAITADDVVDPLARQFGASSDAIRAELSATPIPNSPVIRVDASASSGNSAVMLANAGGDSLISYIDHLNQNNPDSTRLLKEVHRAARDYERAFAAVQGLPNKTPLSTQAQSLQANLETTRLRLDSLEAAYRASVQSQATTSLVQTLTRARSAASNRRSRLELALFVAVVAGILIGLGLAMWRANRFVRRALIATPWELEGTTPTE